MRLGGWEKTVRLGGWGEGCGGAGGAGARLPGRPGPVPSDLGQRVVRCTKTKCGPIGGTSNSSPTAVKPPRS
ncbi:hypothetical protein GCM10027168_50980 [Streptomyces capparidis]